jgi:mRNA interferase MazF
MVKRAWPKQGQVWLCVLDPTRGSEIQKTRPCLVVSPDDLNEKLNTFIIVPMTTGNRLTPFRVACSFQGKNGILLPDQMRSIDRSRTVKLIGNLDSPTMNRTLAILREMFEEQA